MVVHTRFDWGLLIWTNFSRTSQLYSCNFLSPDPTEFIVTERSMDDYLLRGMLLSQLIFQKITKEVARYYSWDKDE